MKYIIFILSFFIATNYAFSQYELKGSVFGSGNKATGSGYIIDGSAGQPLAGEVSETSYTMKVGFWSLLSLSDSVPTILTSSITILWDSKAKSGGYNLNDQGDSILAKGVCWNTTGTPTLSDDYTDEGSDSTQYQSIMTGLQVNTQYYVRAYATNSYGTGYGDEKTFIYTAIPTLPEWGLIIFGGLIAFYGIRKIYNS